MSDGERRLAAIMFTDIVGYTALTQKNEPLALALLEKQRDIVRPIFARHGGREVKTIGDAFLVEFGSALEATESAVELQMALHEFNERTKDKVEVKVGIHVGDVVHRGGDIYGDAVNIASRIEPLAGGGEICVSEQVYAQIRNKVSYPMERLSDQPLKNVDFPIDVYRIVPHSDGPEPSAMPPANRLAVLPLANISPDPRDGYFADGMTEELITVLSQVKGLRVIARTSVDHFRGKDKRVSQIGKELEVGSVMEGSVRMAGDRLRVTVQLIDVRSEEHVWSENYDRKLDDVFSIQTDIARRVAAALKVRLLANEEERLTNLGTESIEAYKAYLRGRTLLAKREPSELAQAKDQFEVEIAQDPTYAPAYAGLADAYYLLGDYWALPVGAARQKSKDLLLKALELDPDLAEAHASLGRDLTNDYKFAEAEKEFKRGLLLNPNCSLAHMWYSTTLGSLKRFDEALEHLRLAEESDPLSVVILFNECLVMAMLGIMAEASEKLRKVVGLDPGGAMVVDLICTYHYLKGDPASGLGVLDEHPELHKDPRIVVDYALMHAAKGDRTKAKEWLEEVLAFPETTFARDWAISLIYGELGDLDDFFLWANRSVEKKEMRFDDAALNPMYRKVREDPRWADLLAKCGLKA